MNAIVRDVMTPDVITVGKDTSFEVIAAALREHRVSAFPVLGEASRVIGVVSESGLPAKLALGLGDDEMPGMITGILSTGTPAGPGTLDVSVRAGVAAIVGRPQTREQGHAIIGRARHVQGVVAVRDRLDYPPPGPGPFDVLASSAVD